MIVGDVGTNPQEGTVEIEAKIGYLINSATDQRIQLPVRTMCVVHDDPNGYVRIPHDLNPALPLCQLIR